MHWTHRVGVDSVRDVPLRRTFARPQLLALLLLGLIVLASPAHAAFPGQNGRIAFESSRDGNSEIYVMNADGTEETRLTARGATEIAPAWRPSA